MSEALRLADALEQQFPIGTAQHYLDGEAAAELRRLHAEHTELGQAIKRAIERNNELEALNAELVEALQLALSSHGVMLLSDPPQDAWKARGVEAKARAALAKLEARK